MKRSPAQIAEEILVLDAQRGDRSSLGELITLCQPAILRHIARMTGKHNSLQDIWQETVIAAMKGLRSLNDPALFRPWLYRIATFKSRDWQRKHYGQRAREDCLDESASSADETPDSLIPDQVKQVMKSLASEQRQLLSMFYREGMSVQEIALALDIKAGTVRTRLFRAREKFRLSWEGENHE